MKITSKKIVTLATIVLIVYPYMAGAAAQPPFMYGGWLPFWKKAQGIEETSRNLNKLTELSPFSYEVRPNGTLIDSFQIEGDAFLANWFRALRTTGTKIIPTVAWFDKNGLHKLLSNTKLRRQHEDNIAALVKAQNFDGIDIDYENKKSETKEYFSTFIYGLALRLHPMGKKLTCTIESRMPLADRYDVIPEDTSVANDYPTLNRYCDEVRVMTYDQVRIDLRLNASKGKDALYAPVADVAWVRKVLDQTVKEIARSKIVLGIPTYGYEYEIAPQAVPQIGQSITQSGVSTTYKIVRSRTYKQAMDLARSVGAVPQRNSAGELSFTYTATSSPFSNSSSSIRFLSVSDAAAAKDKINLAKEYKLGGVVFFKFDGEADPKIWDLMASKW